MKKIIFGLFIFAVTNINAQQQPPQGQPGQPGQPQMQRPHPAGVSPEDRAEKMMARLVEQLTLTPEQQTKVKPIIIKREQDKDLNRKKMDALRDESRKIMDDSDADIKKVLTPEQVTKMGNQRNGMPPMSPRNGDPGAAPMTPPPAKDAPAPQQPKN